jgi:hypothetical protein
VPKLDTPKGNRVKAIFFSLGQRTTGYAAACRICTGT